MAFGLSFAFCCAVVINFVRWWLLLGSLFLLSNLLLFRSSLLLPWCLSWWWCGDYPWLFFYYLFMNFEFVPVEALAPTTTFSGELAAAVLAAKQLCFDTGYPAVVVRSINLDSAEVIDLAVCSESFVLAL